MFNPAEAFQALPKERVWFVSDPHFFMAESYLDMFGRPFGSVAEMHAELLRRWNACVAEEDLVFVLGDVFMTRDASRFEMFNAFRGRKVLVMGNHDENPIEDYTSVFDFVSPTSLYLDFLLLSHAPVFNNGKSPIFNIYGHVHNDVNYRDYTASSFCVSVERIGYCPISLASIIEKVEALRSGRAAGLPC